MTHNEEKYPSSNQFIPERFLNEQGELDDNSAVLAYGFGRRWVLKPVFCESLSGIRICPGRHMASSMVCTSS